MTDDGTRSRSRLHEKVFGYGHFGAKYWFVGLEEGGVTKLSQFEERLHAWHELGEPLLADIRQFHARIGGKNWFRPGAGFQRTWRPLIRTRYAAESSDAADDADLKLYQIEKLASPNGDAALLELLPLPARGRKPSEPWFYNALAIAELRSREKYIESTEPTRRDAIIRLIDEHNPKAVITYGQVNDWRRWLNANEPLNAKAWTTRRGSTVAVCTHHPEGARANEHWDAIGRFIASND